MKQTILPFALLVFAVLVLIQLSRFSRFLSGPGQEVWITVFSLVFLGIGIFISRKFSSGSISRENVQPGQEQDPFVVNENQLVKLNLSKRELEVLQLINEGLSNQQIADKLFVSENTIKKHISNIFLKLDVERRTEAIRKGKSLGILP